MKLAQALLPLTLLVGCGSSAELPTPPEAVAGEDDLISYGDKASPLTASSFEALLTKGNIRAASPDLDDQAFEAKWKASLSESAVMFARAWPGAFHADLAGVSAKRLMGREAVCFGDAHPDNFGYLRFSGKSRYAYNDLDDAGYCPALVDALRYFAIVRLYFGDEALTASLIESYVDGLKDGDARAKIDDDLSPDWGDVAAKQLAKVTNNKRLVAGSKDGLKPASGADTAAVKKAIAGLPALSGAAVLDVGELDRASGGSGGLARYWVLAEKNGEQTLWELKQTATPGTELGRHVKTLPRSTRLATLKKGFWSTTTEGDYVTVPLLGGIFLLRDRLAKKSVDLADLSSHDRKGVLEAQVGLLASFHETAMKGAKKDDLRPWLLASSTVVSARWKALYKASGGK